MGPYRRARRARLPGQSRLGRAAFLGLGAVVTFAVFELVAGLGGARPAEGPACDPGDCAAEAPIAAVISRPEPAPCAYCGLDPDRWRSQTSLAPPLLEARAAVILEGECGDLIYGFNEHERLPPASLTKIVSALVVRDRAALSDRVPVGVNGWELSDEDGSSIMGLEAGMELSVEELLYGMLLPSGNDAALQLAQHLGGTDAFVRAMNQRVARMGLTNTRFVNPDGRHAEGHYSSALDMAILGRALMADETLRKIVGTETYQPDWSGGVLWNINAHLYYTRGVDGVKTGYTEEAGGTIVASVERDGRRLYVSVLGTWDIYWDSIRLFNWAFANTKPSCATAAR